MASKGRPKTLAILKASGRLGSYSPQTGRLLRLSHRGRRSAVDNAAGNLSRRLGVGVLRWDRTSNVGVAVGLRLRARFVNEAGEDGSITKVVGREVEGVSR